MSIFGSKDLIKNEGNYQLVSDFCEELCALLSIFLTIFQPSTLSVCTIFLLSLNAEISLHNPSHIARIFHQLIDCLQIREFWRSFYLIETQQSMKNGCECVLKKQ